LKSLSRMTNRFRAPRFFFISLVIAVALVSARCGPKADAPERRIENGVEVVINGERPYPVNGKTVALTVKEEFRIDLEDPKYAAMGLSDVAKADLDSRGRVILFRQFAGEGPLVFLFDERGKLKSSFGRRGQGPGEIVYPFAVGVTGLDEIAIRESDTKILFFDPRGTLLRSTAISSPVPITGRTGMSLLTNGNYLIQYPRLEEGGDIREIVVGVFDDQFHKIKDLVTFNTPGPIEKISNPFIPVPVLCHSREAIFIGFEKAGQDISVFDLNGNLKRIIRKLYPTVAIPASFRDELLRRMPENHPLRANLRLPANFPAFQFLFSDDEGRLVVATCQKDSASGQNLCDIFAPDGTYIARAPLGYFDILKWMFEGQPGDVVIRSGRLLCVRDKDSGFREVIVSTLTWN
jgi:hypothetical protein